MEEFSKLTRLSLPDDDTYLFRLGTAIYGFASINSFMCEIISHINPEYGHTILQNKDSAQILNIFCSTLKNMKSAGRLVSIQQTMQEVADLFGDLNIQRNDIIHTYPITNNQGQQILHRRKDNKGKYFEVSNDFLDEFISRLHDVSIGLYKIREEVWSRKR
jgi:hypothetical protein